MNWNRSWHRHCNVMVLHHCVVLHMPVAEEGGKPPENRELNRWRVPLTELEDFPFVVGFLRVFRGWNPGEGVEPWGTLRIPFGKIGEP